MNQMIRILSNLTAHGESYGKIEQPEANVFKTSSLRTGLSLLLLGTGFVVANPTAQAASTTINVNCASSQGAYHRMERYTVMHRPGHGGGNNADFTAEIDKIDSELPNFFFIRRWVDDYEYNANTKSINTSALNFKWDNYARVANGFILTTNTGFRNELTDSQLRQAWNDLFTHFLNRYPSKEIYFHFNEPNQTDQGNFGNVNNYYDYYKILYQVIHDVNTTLSPTNPIKMGGPGYSHLSGIEDSWWKSFLNRYRDDTDSRKRLDFIMYNKHGQAGKPKVIDTEKDTIYGWLNSRGLDTSVPFFIGESSIVSNVTGTNAQRNARNASADVAKWYQSLKNSNFIKLFNYSPIYPPVGSRWLDGSGSNAKWTARGNLQRMAKKLKGTRVFGSVTLDSNGLGVYSIATKDNSNGVVSVILTNYQLNGGTNYNITLNVNNLPSQFNGKNIGVKRYLISYTKSNWHHNSNQQLILEEDFTSTQSGTYTKTISLNAGSTTLLELTPTTGGGSSSSSSSSSSGGSAQTFEVESFMRGEVID